MPLTATATVDASGLFTRLAASGGTAPYTWTAYPTGGDPYSVPPTSTDPTGAATIDGAAPFGRAVTYQVRDATQATDDTQPATLPDPPGAVLSDALDPLRHVQVVVVDQPPNVWVARSVWFDVMDRRDPFVAVAPLRFRNGTLVLWVAGNDARGQLLDLLATGVPLLLRSPCAAAVDDVTMLVLQVTEDLAQEDNKAGPRLWSLEYQSVTRELGPYLPDPLWTWDQVDADPRNSSWVALVAGYATWDDVAANVRLP